MDPWRIFRRTRWGVAITLGILFVITGFSYQYGINPRVVVQEALYGPTTPEPLALPAYVPNLVTIEESYYQDDSGDVFLESQFVPKEVDLNVFTQTNKVDLQFVFEETGRKGVRAYIPLKVTFAPMLNAGDVGKIGDAYNNAAYLVETAEGYMEIRVARDPQFGTCEVLGAKPYTDHVLVTVKDIDGVEKALSYFFETSDDFDVVAQSISEPTTRLYEGDPLPSIYIDESGEGLATSVRSDWVNFYWPNNWIIDTLYPCDDLNSPAPPTAMVVPTAEATIEVKPTLVGTVPEAVFTFVGERFYPSDGQGWIKDAAFTGLVIDKDDFMAVDVPAGDQKEETYGVPATMYMSLFDTTSIFVETTDGFMLQLMAEPMPSGIPVPITPTAINSGN